MTKGDWATRAPDRARHDADALQLRDDASAMRCSSSATCWSPARSGRTTIRDGRSGIPATSRRGSAAGSGPGLFGDRAGGGPLVLYWMHCGDIDWFDWVVFVDLIMVGVGYAQMALAASLLARQHRRGQSRHGRSRPIVRIGWDYFRPCLVAASRWCWPGWVCGPCSTGCPTMWIEGLAIWAFWVFLFYAAMVVMRMVGLTYHAHAMRPALVPPTAHDGRPLAATDRFTPIRDRPAHL